MNFPVHLAHPSPSLSFTNTPEDKQSLRLPPAPGSALPGQGLAPLAVGSVSDVGLCGHGFPGYVCVY